MLINLVPEFLSVLAAGDPFAAYRRYYAEHQPVLEAYWRNYIIDPESPQADEILRRTLSAQRRDLYDLLEHVDVERIAADALSRCEEQFAIDRPADLYLMIGVGGANAGELVVGGRGIGFVCLEHFTGRPNAETYGLGLSPELLPLWIGHEMAHTVRYTSRDSRSELARLIFEARGNYDYWTTGGQATLLELLVNEGLAVAGAREIAPGFETREYLGYGSHQYRRMRALEAFLRQHLAVDLDRTGLGYRLRYLAGGTSPESRTLAGKTIPERAGYYLGLRLVEPLVEDLGIAAALRASAADCLAADQRQRDARSA